MQIRLLKDTQCAGDLHEMTKYPRPWFKAKPTLPKDTVLTVSKRWTNFYGSYYRCEHENGTYDIPVDSAEPLLLSASDNRMFPDSVMDKIQFHDGDEPIIVRVPKLNVGSRPRKDPFGSILPRLKRIRLSKRQVQELERLMETSRQYGSCMAASFDEAVTTVVKLHVAFSQINKQSTMQLKEGDIFYQAFRTSTPMSFQVLSVDRDNNKCRVLCTSFEGHSHEETWDDLDLTEIAFDIGEYKMADLSKYPAYDVSKTYKDGDLFEYNGHVTMYYGERLINIPFGLEEYDDMVSYCKSKSSQYE